MENAAFEHEDEAFRRLEQRMDELDHKLDLVLEAIRKRAQLGQNASVTMGSQRPTELTRKAAR